MLNDKCDEELIKAAGDKLKVVSSFSAGGEYYKREARQVVPQHS